MVSYFTFFLFQNMKEYSGEKSGWVAMVSFEEFELVY